MNDQQRPEPVWQEWQLTAFLLGELDPDLAQQISVAAERDPGLAFEIHSLREMLDQVSQVYQAESQAESSTVGLASSGFEQLLQQASHVELARQPAAQSRSRTVMWLSLLTTSAVVLLTLWFSAPRLPDWALSWKTPPHQQASVDGKAEPVAELNEFEVEDLTKSVELPTLNHYGASAPQELGPGSSLSVAPAPNDAFATENAPLSSNVARSSVVSSPSIAMPASSPAHPSMGGEGMGMGVDAGIAGGALGGGGPGGVAGDRLATGEQLGLGGMPSEAEYVIDFMEGYSGTPANAMGGYDLNAGLASYESVLEEAREPLNQFYFRGHQPGVRASESSRFAPIVENVFERVEQTPLSTFSIDVDTASYAKSRQLLMETSQLPPAAAVRIEEFINYFDYEYAGPTGDAPFGVHLAAATCPWRPEHHVVRIALQSPKLDLASRAAANVVFLLDVSGSMNEPNKLPLVKESMRMLIEQLGENDKVGMVVYAGAAGCVLESTRGDKQTEILAALDRLQAGGSTNGGDGIQLAYQIARDNFIPGGINRVVLCTDGDFNVGVTSTEALVDLVVENAKSKTFLTVLGYGMGNTNDAMMEEISNRGNGVYAFVDSWREAKRQMVQQLSANLITVAKDVKVQVEFNPQHIKAYRLLGYENRILAAEDFNDDKKDAGEIGAGHRVTALFEVVPTSSESDAGRPTVDELRYQKKPTPKESVVVEAAEASNAEVRSELLAVKLRYKQPEGDTSQLLVFPLDDVPVKFSQADLDFQWAASVAEFGMLLRGSRYSGSANWSGLIEQATTAAGASPDPLREECLQMIRRAAQLAGPRTPTPQSRR